GVARRGDMVPEVEAFWKEHAIETYKSLIQVSVEGLKLLAILNGGAAVAILAYLGNTAGKQQLIPDMRWPMGLYLLGLVLCGLAFIASYLTQLRLYNESVGRAGRIIFHQLWLRIALICVLLSILAFAVGSLLAVWHFK